MASDPPRPRTEHVTLAYAEAQLQAAHDVIALEFVRDGGVYADNGPRRDALAWACADAVLRSAPPGEGEALSTAVRELYVCVIGSMPEVRQEEQAEMEAILRRYAAAVER